MSNDVKVKMQVDADMAKAISGSSTIEKNLKGAAEAAKATGKAMSGIQAPKQASQTQAYKTANQRANSTAENVEYGIARSVSTGTGAMGRDFAKQAQGLGGLVHVYATFAANLFAVGAAFSALKSAADTTNMIKGLDQLGAASGRNLGGLSKEVVRLTDGAVSLRDAMEAVGKASSSGMSDANIKRLATGASQASKVLGVGMADALSRLSRGIAKIEPELLDEIGIFVRVDKAAQDYARNLGKPVSALTDFEKRAGFANAVLDQMDQKFGKIKMDANPYDKLLAGLKDLGQTALETVNKYLGPLISLLAASPTGLAVAMTGIVGVLLKQAIPALGSVRDSMAATAEQARQVANIKAVDARNSMPLKEKQALLDLENKIEDKIADVIKAENALKTVRSQDSTKDLKKNTAAFKLLAAAEKDMMSIDEKLFKNVEKKAASLDREASKLEAMGQTKEALAAKEAALTQRSYVAAVRANIQAENDFADETKRRTAIYDLMSKGSSTVAQNLRIAERANQEFVSKSIASNAAYVGSTQGLAAAVKKAWADVQKARQNSYEIQVPAKDKEGNPLLDANGKELTKMETITNKKMGGIRAAWTMTTASIGAFTGAMGTAMNALGIWGAVAGIAVSAITMFASWVSSTAEESAATATAITGLESSTKNLSNTLEYVSKLSPLEQFSTESIQAKATAINGLADSMVSAVSAAFLEIEKMNGWDRLFNNLWDLLDKGIEDKLAASLSNAIGKSVKSLNLKDAEALSSKLSSILGINISKVSTKELENHLENLAKSDFGKQAIKEATDAQKKFTQELAVTAAKGTELKNNLEQTTKTLKTFTNSFIPSDNFSRLGTEIITSAESMGRALDSGPIESLNAMTLIINDASKLSLFPPNISSGMSDAAAAINKLNIDFKTNEAAIESNNKAIEIYKTQLQNLSSDINGTAAQQQNATTTAVELTKAIERLSELNNTNMEVKVKLGIEVEKYKDMFSTGVKESFRYGASIVSSRLEEQWAKVGTAIGGVVASLLGNTRAGIEMKAKLDTQVLAGQLKGIETQQNMIKSVYINNQRLEESRIAMELLTIALQKSSNTATPEDYDREVELKKEKAVIQRGRQETGNIGKGSYAKMVEMYDKGLVDKNSVDLAQQLEASFANTAGIMDQIGAVKLRAIVDATRADYNKVIEINGEKGKTLALELESLSLQKNKNGLSDTEQLLAENALNYSILENKQQSETLASLQYIHGMSVAIVNTKGKAQEGLQKELDTYYKTTFAAQQLKQEKEKENLALAQANKLLIDRLNSESKLLQHAINMAELEGEKQSVKEDTKLDIMNMELEYATAMGTLSEEEIIYRKKNIGLLKIEKDYREKILSINNSYSSKILALQQKLVSETNIDEKSRIAAELEATQDLFKTKLDQEDLLHEKRVNNIGALADAESTSWLRKGVTDSIITALEEGGKAGAKKLRDILKAKLKEKFVISIEASVGDIITKLMSSSGGGSGGGLVDSIINGVIGIFTGNSGGSGSSSWSSLLSIGKTVYDMYKGSTAGVAGQAISYAGQATRSLGLQAYGTGMSMTAAQSATAAGLYAEASANAVLAANNSLLAAEAAKEAGQIALASQLEADAMALGVQAQGYTTAGEGILSGSSAAGTVMWVAAIVMGMYMSSQAWKAGIRWENYAKEDGSQYDAETYMRASKDKPLEAIFGKDFINSEFYAVMSGSALSAQLHMAIKNFTWGGDWRPDGSNPRMYANISDKDGVTGRTEQDWVQKRGIFRKDKHETRRQDFSAEADKVFTGLYYSIRNSLVLAGEALEDTSISDKLKVFVKDYFIPDARDMQAVFNDISNKISTDLGNLVYPSIQKIKDNIQVAKDIVTSNLAQATAAGNASLAETLKKDLETLTAQNAENWNTTFGRVLQETQVFARILELLGSSLHEAFGVNNADAILKASDNLATLFGGIDNLNTSFGKYYASYYSKEEQTAQAWKDVNESFKRLNIYTVPKTRAEFRALVDGLDKTTLSGQIAFKGLMDVEEAFASLTPAIDGVVAGVDAALYGLGKSDFASILTEGITGAISTEDLVTKTNKLISDGLVGVVSNAQVELVTEAISSQLVTPFITSIVTGTSLSTAISEEAITQVTNKAVAAASAMDAMFNNPEFISTSKRLSDSVTNIMKTLSKSLKGLVYTAKELADILLKASQDLADAKTTYVNNFGTKEQIAANMKENLTKSFSGLKTVMPESKEAYTNLIDSLQITAKTWDKDIQNALSIFKSGYDVSTKGSEGLDWANQILKESEAGLASIGLKIGDLENPTYIKLVADKLNMTVQQFTDTILKDIQIATVAKNPTLFAEKAKTVLETSGIAIPKSIEDLENLINTLGNDGIGPNQEKLIALEKLAPDLKTYFTALEDIATEITKAKQDILDKAKVDAEVALALATTAADNAYAALERAVEAQRTLYQTALDAANLTVSTIQEVFDTLTSNTEDLYSSVTSITKVKASVADNFIEAVLQNAKTTGTLPSNTDLVDAIGSIRNGIDQTIYTSEFEKAKASLVLAGKLSQLKNIAQPQLTAAEQSVKLLNDQIEGLDNILKTNKDLLDTAKGIDTSILSVAAAVTGLAVAIENLKTASAVSKAATAAAATPATVTPTTPATAEATTWSSKQLADARTFFASAPTPDRIYDVGVSNRFSVSQYADLYSKAGLGSYADASKGIYDYLAATNKNLLGGGSIASAQIPSYDIGTNYVPKDMLANIHKGEAIIPKAYNPMLNGDNNEAVVKELQELRKSLEIVQYQLNLANNYNKQTADATNGKQGAPVLVQITNDKVYTRAV